MSNLPSINDQTSPVPAGSKLLTGTLTRTSVAHQGDTKGAAETYRRIVERNQEIAVGYFARAFKEMDIGCDEALNVEELPCSETLKAGLLAYAARSGIGLTRIKMLATILPELIAELEKSGQVWVPPQETEGMK